MNTSGREVDPSVLSIVQSNPDSNSIYRFERSKKGAEDPPLFPLFVGSARHSTDEYTVWHYYIVRITKPVLEQIPRQFSIKGNTKGDRNRLTDEK